MLEIFQTIDDWAGTWQAVKVMAVLTGVTLTGVVGAVWFILGWEGKR